MKIKIFRHVFNQSIGNLENVFRKQGLEWDYIDAFHEIPDDFDPLAPDLTIFLGGPPTLDQADDYPFITQELKILEDRLKADKPVLGICLGAQLLAAALGARVYKGEKGPEVGWDEITLTPEGKNSPARHFDHSVTKVLQWHSDTFDIPQGAVSLAESEKYNQIFSWGEKVMGIQPHIEMTPVMASGWLSQAAGLAASGSMDIGKFRSENERYMSAFALQSNRFLIEYLERAELLKVAKAEPQPRP